MARERRAHERVPIPRLTMPAARAAPVPGSSAAGLTSRFRGRQFSPELHLEADPRTVAACHDHVALEIAGIAVMQPVSDSVAGFSGALPWRCFGPASRTARPS
jgi:hypothetical protein